MTGDEFKHGLAVATWIGLLVAAMLMVIAILGV